MKETRVVAYRKDGSLYRIYLSARQASLSRHAHPRTIDKCIRGDTLTAFGYIWKRFPVDNIPNKIEPLLEKEVSTTKKAVALIDDNGNVLKTYSSIRKAAIDNEVDSHSIRDVLSGKYKAVKNKKFRYLITGNI